MLGNTPPPGKPAAGRKARTSVPRAQERGRGPREGQGVAGWRVAYKRNAKGEHVVALIFTGLARQYWETADAALPAMTGSDSSLSAT